MSCEECGLCKPRKFKKGVISKGDVIDLKTTYHFKNGEIQMGITFTADTAVIKGCTYSGFFVHFYRNDVELFKVFRTIPKVIFTHSRTDEKIMRKLFPHAEIRNYR